MSVTSSTSTTTTRTATPAPLSQPQPQLQDITTTPIQQQITPSDSPPLAATTTIPPTQANPSTPPIPPDVENPRRNLPLQIPSPPPNPQPPPPPPPSHAQTLSLPVAYSSSETRRAQKTQQGGLSKTQQAQQGALSKIKIQIKPGTVAARIQALAARQRAASERSPVSVVSSSTSSSSSSSTKQRRPQFRIPNPTPDTPPAQCATQRGEEEKKARHSPPHRWQNEKQKRRSLFKASSSGADSSEAVQSDEVGTGVACKGGGAEEGERDEEGGVEGEGESEGQEEMEGIKREAWVGEGKGEGLLSMGIGGGSGGVLVTPNFAKAMERSPSTRERGSAPYCRHGRLRLASTHTHSNPASPMARDQAQSLPSTSMTNLTTTKSKPIKSNHHTNFKFDPSNPRTQFAERAMADLAFGRAVCQECVFEAARREGVGDTARVEESPPAGGLCMPAADDDYSTTTRSQNRKPSGAADQEPHLLDLHRPNADSPNQQECFSKSLTNGETADNEIEDLTSLIRTLDEIIAEHILKLRTVGEALARARELGELNCDGDGDEADGDDALESDWGVGDPRLGSSTSSAKTISISPDSPTTITPKLCSTSFPFLCPGCNTANPRKRKRKKNSKPEAHNQWLAGLSELIGLVDEQLRWWDEGERSGRWEREGGLVGTRAKRSGQDRDTGEVEEMGPERRGSLYWDALDVAGPGPGPGPSNQVGQ